MKMNGKKVMIKRLFSLLFAVMMFLNLSVMKVDAENPKTPGTVADETYGVNVSDSGFNVLPLNTSSVSTDDIPSYTESLFDNYVYPGVPDMDGHTYSATYERGINYYGKDLDVLVQVTKKSNGSMTAFNPDNIPSEWETDNGFVKIFIDKNNMVRVWWWRAYDVQIEWQITLLDSDTKQEYKIPLLIGFKDPDESNYLFNTSDVFFYYNDDAVEAANNFLVASNGIKRCHQSGGSLVAYEPADHINLGDFMFNDSGLFLVEKSQPWSQFVFTSDTFCNGALDVPYFYTTNYDVYYQPNWPVPASELDKYNHGGTTVAQENNPFNSTPITVSPNGFYIDGYRWNGWNTQKNGEGVSFGSTGTYCVPDMNDINNSFNIAVPADGDVTLYAQWEPTYNVKYDPNGGIGDTKPQNNLPFEDKDVTVSENGYTRENYRFIGWNTKPDGSGVGFSADGTFNVPKPNDANNSFETAIPVGGEVTLFAQWQPLYNVKYAPNFPAEGGKGETAPQKNLPFEEKDVTVSPNGYSITGYSFVGWNTKPDGSGVGFSADGTFNVPKVNDANNSFNEAIPAGGEVTLYAQWDMWKYKIHYDGNGGEGYMETQTFTYYDTTMISKSNVYWADGYNFVGFEYTAKDGNKYLYTSVYDFNKILRDLGPWSEITLVALWERIPDRYVAPVTGIK